nr:hypothetical protein [Tanacetum cinerariifolium]
NTKFANQSILGKPPKVGEIHALSNVISKVVYAICKQCLISVNHDACLRNYVNGKTSRGKRQKANVSIKENKRNISQRWSPTGRLFDQKGKILKSSEPESQSDCSNGDNACTSNTLEPKIKRFPNANFSMAGNSNMFMMSLTSDELEALEQAEQFLQ